MADWFIYLIECVDGSLYTGITTDVDRRYAMHLAGKGARYTRTHPPQRLLGARLIGSRSQALRAEIALKRVPKSGKLTALAELSIPPAR